MTSVFRPITYKLDRETIALREIQGILTSFEQKPLLYKGSLHEFNKVIEECKEFFVGDINNSVFDLFVQSLRTYHIEGQPEYEAVKIEYSRIKEEVLASDACIEFLSQDFDHNCLKRLEDLYLQQVPASTLRQMVEADAHLKRTSRQSTRILSIEELTELNTEVQVLLRFVADNPNNNETQQQLRQIMDRSFLNYPTFRKLMVFLLLPDEEVVTDDENAIEGGSTKTKRKKKASTLPFSEPLSRLLTTLLTNYITSPARSGAFQFVMAQVILLLSIEAPEFVNIVTRVFSTSERPLEIIGEPQGYEFVVQFCGGLKAVLIKNQVPLEIAHNTVAHVAYELLTNYEESANNVPWDENVRKWLWSVYNDFQPHALSYIERLGFFLSGAQRRIEDLGVPEGFIGSIVNAFYVSMVSLYGLADKIIEILLQGVFAATGTLSKALLEYTYLGRAFFSIALPEARRRPKAVWALLFANDFKRLTPAQKFAISCNLMEEPSGTPEYYEWANKIADMLNATEKSDVKLNVEVPLRFTKLPQNPMVSSSDLADVVPLMPETNRVATLVKDSIQSWIKSGVPQGIDASWFATPERIHHSISRYAVTRPDIDMDDYYLMKEVTASMANRDPHLYKDAIYMTPGAAAAKIKKKYSPGLPFIPQFRSRAQIRDHGFFRAIEQVAAEVLQKGIHTNTAAHCFEKMNVVDLSKLLLTGDKQKAIVTVIAEDLLSSVIALCALGDLGKRVPKVGDWVMNSVKRSEGGFMPFYEELQKRKTIIQADAKQFDSSLGALVAVEGLADLRGHGYTGSAIEDIAQSQIRARYIALRDAVLISLIDGLQHGHTGGLMTGQALTATDNRDCFRMVIIFCWSKATGRHPSLFWDTNTLGNAGDDNCWGSDDGEEVMTEALALAEAATGVKILTEARGFENLDLTGLQIIPVPEHSKGMYIQMGREIPKFSLRTTPEKLLMKKTEFKVSLSRLRDLQFYAGHIDVLVGSAMLTAHNLPIYHHFAHDYMREMEYVLLRFFKSIEWEVTRSDDGFITGTVAHLGQPRARTNQTTMQQWQKWIKTHRLMSYQNIFKIWLEPNDMDKSRMVKAHQKMLALNPQVSSLDKANWGFLLLREAFYKYIPNHVARAMPEFAGKDISITLRNQSFTIGKFVWLSYYNLHNKIPSDTLLMALLRENPFASAEDPVSFIDWLAQDDNIQRLVKLNLESLRGQMLAVTMVYYYIETIAKAISFVPGLGILWTLFALCTRDVNRLYSFTNYFYMIATGRSSPVISNLMPPDPYAWIKQLSVLITNILPPHFYLIFPGLKHIVSLVPSMVEWWVAADQITHPNIARRLHKVLNTPAAWDDVLRVVDRLTNGCQEGDILVVAPTGTGKSTAFIKGIFQQLAFNNTIWLLQPTKTARDNYTNDFLTPEIVQILMKGVLNINAKRLKILTPGHFCVRYKAGEVMVTDLVIIDESHLCQAAQLYAWFISAGGPRMQLTATPSPMIFPRPLNSARYVGGKRFATKILRPKVEFEALIQYLYKEKPHLLVRALIVCPTIRKVRETILTLGRLSLEAYELSSDFPVAEKRGTLVATTIVDTAVTIDPPPTCLIDFGDTLEIKYKETDSMFPEHQVTVVPTGPSANTQRTGRVGRKGDSIAYLLGNAGLGSDPVPTPTVRDLLYDNEIAPQVFQAYGIKLSVKAVVTMTGGLVDFIDIDPVEQPAAVNARSFALAALIFSELSGGISLDAARNRYEMYRLGNNDSEEYQLLVQLVTTRFGCTPIEGTWTHAIDLIEARAIGARMKSGTFVPCSCLVIKKGVVLPNTLKEADYTGFKAFIASDPITNKFPRSQMLTLETFITSVNTLPHSWHLIVPTEGWGFVDVEFPETVNFSVPVVATQGHRWWSALRGALLTLRLSRPLINFVYIEILFNEEVPTCTIPNVIYLHVVSRNCNQIRGAYLLDVRAIPLSTNYKILWILAILSLLDDNVVGIYNLVDIELLNCTKKHRDGFFCKLTTSRIVYSENLVTTPRRARNLALTLVAASLQQEDIIPFLFELPLDVFADDNQPIDLQLQHSPDSVLCENIGRQFNRTVTTGAYINLWHSL